MYELMLKYVILLCYIIVSTLASNLNCIPLEASLIQNVENGGFHRNIKWLLEISPQSYEDLDRSDCNLVIHVVMPPGAFANPDQLGDLNRTGTLKSFIDRIVDVEIPEHEAEFHSVYIYLEKNYSNALAVSLPIHLRYQRAQLSGGYGSVVLPKPTLLIHCQHSETICSAKKTISAPCDSSAQHNCRWKNLSYEALFDEVVLYVPVGDLDDYPLVSVVTLLIGCVGCIYVLSLLSTKGIQ